MPANKVQLGDRVRPMPGRVAIQIATKDENIGGIFVPREVARTVHEERPTTGIVVSLGDGEDDEEGYGLRIGDRVLFGKYSGVKISWQNPEDRNDREEVVILNVKEILAVLYNTDGEALENLKVRS